ncbi:hypothetical protein [Streptomyces sp. NPDC086182]|uniref:hypothetical protein n=1 Tax=Streptomyces sp. NPDC086182 TaxID=3155058 RepID=UPI00343D9466
MNAPTHDPLVVNTQDGSTWLRRAVTRGGKGLYALAGTVPGAPDMVLATMRELAEHGLASVAFALPMPVGTQPRTESLPLHVVAELYNLRTRLAGMAHPPREVFLAEYEGAEPELFTTAEAARGYCDDLAPTDAYDKGWDWTVNEHGIHVQFWTHADDDRPLSETSGLVTPLVVQGDDDLSELERLRAEVAELRAERHVTNEALDDAVRELRARQAPTADGITRRIAPTQALREDAEDVSPQVAKLRGLFAGQRAALEDSHDSPLHHNYRVPRDLEYAPPVMPSDAGDVVAYRDPHRPQTLLCREHGPRYIGMTPVTAEDLPDGGVCTYGGLSSLACGRDVLAGGAELGGAR